jgi:RimJ/RimL family protein N-acetyltransferase
MLNLGSVELTPLTIDHIEEVRKWRNNSNVRKWLVDQSEISEEQQLNWYRTRNPSTEFYFIALHNRTPFGLVYAKHYDGIQAESGIFCDELYLSKPHGLVAAYLLLEFCFETLKCKRVVASHFNTNTKIDRVNEIYG